jgi:uncharacterized protein (TIGR03435 family)
VARNGPKLKPSTEAYRRDAITAIPDPRHPALAPDGFPAVMPPSQRDPGMSMFGAPHGRKVFFFGRTMRDLASYLWERLHSPVTDSTALTSEFDFTLTYLPDDRPTPPSGSPASQYPLAPDVFKALETQLGIRLEKRKVGVEMLVVDHIEKIPTENYPGRRGTAAVAASLPTVAKEPEPVRLWISSNSRALTPHNHPASRYASHCQPDGCRRLPNRTASL